MEHLTPVLVVLRATGALLAAALFILGVRAWRASGDTRMLRLTLGFGLLLFSLVIEWASFQFLYPGDLLIAHVVEAATQLAAFAVLVWALF